MRTIDFVVTTAFDALNVSFLICRCAICRYTHLDSTPLKKEKEIKDFSV
jgi:hypothetical protein